MLLTKILKITLNYNMIKYYEDLGYYIPKIKNTKNKLITPRGTKIEIKIEDLPKGSDEKVEVECDGCGKKLDPIKYRDYNRVVKDNGEYYCYDCTHNIYAYEYVKNKYEQAGFLLLDKEYKTVDLPMKCICKEHPQYIQEKSFRMILDNRMCYYCQHDIQKKEGHPNWKGGVTPLYQEIRHSEEYLHWRKEVFKRDNYTCQCCGNNSGNLEAHHIKNFSENEDLRFDIDNGITLCNKCHNPNQKDSFHNIYGTYNNSETQLQEYINSHKN